MIPYNVPTFTTDNRNENNWLDSGVLRKEYESTMEEAGAHFAEVTGQIQDDPGYRRCSCEDFPCCGH